MEGIEAFLEHEQVFARAFPDARAELVPSVESEDMVMAEGISRAHCPLPPVGSRALPRGPGNGGILVVVQGVRSVRGG